VVHGVYDFLEKWSRGKFLILKELRESATLKTIPEKFKRY
jgi:hypothetical protein